MTEAENAAIKRQVYFERVKNARADKVLSLLDDADKRIAELLRKTKGVETRKRYNEIAKAIKALAKSLRERIAEGLDTEEIIDSELDARRKFINDFCGVKVDDFTLPTTKQVLTAAEFAPIVGSMTYQSYLDGIRDGLFNAWDSAVRTGYLTGATTQSIVKRVLGSAAGNAKLADAGEIATLRNSVWRNTRTALQSFARVTRDAVYEANADIFSGYKFLATLDKRTCPVCGALDGKIYKRLEDVPKVPLHHNCRCIAIPVVKGMDFSDTRASMNGQVDSKVTYEEWLRAQSEAVQKDVLGTTRYKLWQAGEPLGGFIDNGRVMTIKQLNDKMNVRYMANGQRRSIFADMSEEDKKRIIQVSNDLHIDKDDILFVQNHQTSYNTTLDKVVVGSDVFPSDDGSTNNRDTMTEKAVLAHEYYGHKHFRNTSLKAGDTRDEFRASFYAAVNAPNLSDVERQSLMRDALDRAKEGGIKITITDTVRRILYGR